MGTSTSAALVVLVLLLLIMTAAVTMACYGVSCSYDDDAEPDADTETMVCHMLVVSLNSIMPAAVVLA